jgi:CubicO group peptidase (beta-lactamase class C family)
MIVRNILPMALTILFACLPDHSLADSIFSSETEALLTSYVDLAMACRHVPGMVISVVKGNQTWIRGFGHADKSTGRKVDERSLFGIGSLTKAFTSTLLAALLNGSRYISRRHC